MTRTPELARSLPNGWVRNRCARDILEMLKRRQVRHLDLRAQTAHNPRRPVGGFPALVVVPRVVLVALFPGLPVRSALFRAEDSCNSSLYIITSVNRGLSLRMPVQYGCWLCITKVWGQTSRSRGRGRVRPGRERGVCRGGPYRPPPPGRPHQVYYGAATTLVCVRISHRPGVRLRQRARARALLVRRLR